MKKIFALTVLCWVRLYCLATEYYCSPAGGGDGSAYGKPAKFEAMLSRLQAGDVLYCLGGQYDFSSPVNVSVSGTSAKRICIFNYPGEQPVFDFRKEDYGQRGVVVREGANYLHIKGLVIRYTGKNALHNSGSYNIFENIDAYGNGDTGIQMKAGGNNLILNCDSHDNFDYQLGGVSACDFGGNADGFADKQYTGGGNTYRGCRAWNNSDDGWDFFQRVNTSGTVTVLENCVCYKNGPDYYDMRNHGRYEKDKSWFDQFQGSGRQVTIKNDGGTVNVTLERYYNNGNGNGFKLGGGYTNNVVRVVGCLAVGNTVKGFDQNNNDGTMEIYNCSAWQNGQDYGFYNKDNGTVIAKNNLSLGGSYTFARSNAVNVNNSWNISGITCNASDFQSLDDALVLIDRQADGTLTETPFMRLVAGSDLIDRGIDLGLGYPYAGEAPDLGCFEYGEVSYPAILTCTTANLTQNVKQGQAVTDIVITWGGQATGATVSDLPDGLQTTLSSEDKTLVISGVPQAVGTYQFAVDSQQEEGVKGMSLTVAITVREDLGDVVAYVTVPGSAADVPVLSALQARFDVVEVDAAQGGVDYSGYDLVVISSVPGSTLTGMPQLKGVAKPVLLLKPWVMKSGVWSWGTAANTADVAMRITRPDHAIFTDVTIQDGQLAFFSQANTNAVTYISQWTSASTYTELATPVSATGQSIFELPAGGTYNGTTLACPLLCVGLSEYSLASLTAAGQQVLVNACDYLLGHTVSTSIRQLAADSPSAGVVYDLQGRRLSNSQWSNGQMKPGLYIINGRKVVIKMLR